MSNKNTHELESKGLLSNLNEMGPHQAKAAILGVVAVGALLIGAQKISERLSDIAQPHEVTKTKVVNNARDPRAGYNQVTATTEYTQQEIGGK